MRRFFTAVSTAAIERQNPELASALKKINPVAANPNPQAMQKAMSRLTPAERRAYMEAAQEQGATERSTTSDAPAGRADAAAVARRPPHRRRQLAQAQAALGSRSMKSGVLILGAGFGGLELATMLSEALGDDVDVTLIDKSDAFVFGYSKLDVMFGRTTLDAVRLPYRDLVEARRALPAGDDHGDRSRGAARHAPTPASTRPTSWSSRSAPTTTSTPRPGSPRRATSSTRSPAPRGWRELLPDVHAGPRGHRRLRRAVQVPAGAERGRAAAARLPRRRAASATPARSRS